MARARGGKTNQQSSQMTSSTPPGGPDPTLSATQSLSDDDWEHVDSETNATTNTDSHSIATPQKDMPVPETLKIPGTGLNYNVQTFFASRRNPPEAKFKEFLAQLHKSGLDAEGKLTVRSLYSLARKLQERDTRQALDKKQWNTLAGTIGFDVMEIAAKNNFDDFCMRLPQLAALYGTGHRMVDALAQTRIDAVRFIENEHAEKYKELKALDGDPALQKLQGELSALRAQLEKETHLSKNAQKGSGEYKVEEMYYNDRYYEPLKTEIMIDDHEKQAEFARRADVTRAELAKKEEEFKKVDAPFQFKRRSLSAEQEKWKLVYKEFINFKLPQKPDPRAEKISDNYRQIHSASQIMVDLLEKHRVPMQLDKKAETEFKHAFTQLNNPIDRSQKVMAIPLTVGGIAPSAPPPSSSIGISAAPAVSVASAPPLPPESVLSAAAGAATLSPAAGKAEPPPPYEEDEPLPPPAYDERWVNDLKNMPPAPTSDLRAHSLIQPPAASTGKKQQEDHQQTIVSSSGTMTVKRPDRR